MARLNNPPRPGEVLIQCGAGNVFADLGVCVEDAANLRLRSALMIRVEHYVQEPGALRWRRPARRASRCRGSMHC
jgi:hypothetical protein